MKTKNTKLQTFNSQLPTSKPVTSVKYYKSSNDYANLYIMQENEACIVLRMFKTDQRPKIDTATTEQVKENWHLEEITEEQYNEKFKEAKKLMNAY